MKNLFLISVLTGLLLTSANAGEYVYMTQEKSMDVISRLLDANNEVRYVDTCNNGNTVKFKLSAPVPNWIFANWSEYDENGSLIYTRNYGYQVTPITGDFNHSIWFTTDNTYIRINFGEYPEDYNPIFSYKHYGKFRGAIQLDKSQISDRYYIFGMLPSARDYDDNSVPVTCGQWLQ